MSFEPPELRFATDLQRNFVALVSEVLATTAGVVGASVAGSIARGNADEWSDVDLNVFVEPGRTAQELLQARHLTLRRCGELLLVADLSALVAGSCMAFFASGIKAHLTYKTLADDANRSDRFGDVPICGGLSIVKHLTPASGDCVGDVFSAPDESHDPEMFTFWTMRVVVAAARGDDLSGLESRLQLLELVFADLALTRQTDFHGVRKAHQYLGPDELRNYLGFARSENPKELVAQVTAMLDGYLLDDNGEPRDAMCAAAFTACGLLLREGRAEMSADTRSRTQ